MNFDNWILPPRIGTILKAFQAGKNKMRKSITFNNSQESINKQMIKMKVIRLFRLLQGSFLLLGWPHLPTPRQPLVD